MKQLFTTISDHIRTALPEIKWIDADYGQINSSTERPAIAFPALLIRSSITPVVICFQNHTYNFHTKQKQIKDTIYYILDN